MAQYPKPKGDYRGLTVSLLTVAISEVVKVDIAPGSRNFFNVSLIVNGTLAGMIEIAGAETKVEVPINLTVAAGAKISVGVIGAGTSGPALNLALTTLWRQLE